MTQRSHRLRTALPAFVLALAFAAPQTATAQKVETAASTANAAGKTEKPKKSFTGTQVPKTDRQMALAITMARRSLPEFIGKMQKPEGAREFAVKIPYRSSKGVVEHIWAIDPRLTQDGKISAVINSIPRDIDNLKRGERVTVDRKRLSDWGYSLDNKIHGYYTLRALLKYMQPQQAAHYRKRLAPLKAMKAKP